MEFLFIFKIGDMSLPLELPEMLDDDLLKQLHHVLLEASANSHRNIPHTVSL